MSAPEVGALVVGAGIAGLAAALELQAATPEVVVIDASDRPGGVMRTDHRHGYVIERGPNTVRVGAPMRAMLSDLGLESLLQRARPASKLRFVYHEDRLEKVPMSPLAFARTPLLSLRGKLRLMTEPLRRRADGAQESVAEFASRRLGGEAVTRLIGPFLTGVYAGDERELGAAAVFPALVEFERRHGSIALGALAKLGRRGERGLPGSYGGREGFGPFARRLAERLTDPPAMNSRVVAIRREGELWQVDVAGSGSETSLRSRRVVVAAPADEAGRMLRATDPTLAGLLAEIDYAPIVSLALGVDPERLRTPVTGFGFLVPRDSGPSLLGCLFMSQLFPSRAPEGRELLQCLLGGRRWPEAVELPDDELVARVRRDLDGILGLAGEPETLAVTRWPRAIPQPDRQHVRRVEALRARTGELPGLALAGAYLDGVSVPDTLASGLRAARYLCASGD